MKTQKTIINLLALVLFIAAFSWVSNEDYKDAKISAEHAQYVKQLAKQEADERKAEFNRLAFEGEYMTGFEGDIK